MDFCSSYYASSNNWKRRQEERIWDIFLKLDQRLRRTTSNKAKALEELAVSWDACFPTFALSMTPHTDNEKGTICLGLPDAIFSLHPFLYLKNHVPAKVAKNWNVVLEDLDHPQKECLLVDRLFPADEILVDIAANKEFRVNHQVIDGNNVVISVYHPHLKELMTQDMGHEAMLSAINCVCSYLPQSARLLYVDCIALSGCKPLKERSFPLPEIKAQFEARNMATDIPLDQVLERRRRKYTRKPIHSNRPRTDITHGETAMPELEEIYFQRNAMHLEAMERYGTGAWFLTIPRAVCGPNFQTFREALENAARKALGDEICFVGWAVGTKNYYIDLITVCGGRMLDFFLGVSHEIPECKKILCSTFYWNSDLYSFNYIVESAKFSKLKFTGPVKELASQEMRTAMKNLFSATQWERPDIPMPKLPDDSGEDDAASEDGSAGQTGDSGYSVSGDPATLIADGEENFDPREFIEEDPHEIFGDLLGEFMAENNSLFRQAMANQASGGNLGGTAKSAPPRPVHNTKRKGLSRKKDKNKRKKKK